MLCSLQASQFYTAIYLRGVLLYLMNDIFNEKLKKKKKKKKKKIIIEIVDYLIMRLLSRAVTRLLCTTQKVSSVLILSAVITSYYIIYNKDILSTFDWICFVPELHRSWPFL